MSYTVIHYFTDLQDNNHPYQVGDKFPRQGAVVSESRLKALLGNENKQGKPLIRVNSEPIVEEETPKKRGRKPNNQ